ncbi:MFS transporter [Bradyrhizobium retamae]|nr:MFS transporter [Bradyrhizobium retamae]
MQALIACRIVQGLGAGGLRAVAMSTVSDLVSPRERGRYQVYFSAAFSVSSLCGPTLGSLCNHQIYIVGSSTYDR